MRLRTEGITWQEIDGELVILALQSSMYLTTNGSGAFLAKLLIEERTEQELATALAKEFDIADDVAAADTVDFLEQLADKKLLVSS